MGFKSRSFWVVRDEDVYSDISLCSKEPAFEEELRNAWRRCSDPVCCPPQEEEDDRLITISSTAEYDFCEDGWKNMVKNCKFPQVNHGDVFELRMEVVKQDTVKDMFARQQKAKSRKNRKAKKKIY